MLTSSLRALSHYVWALYCWLRYAMSNTLSAQRGRKLPKLDHNDLVIGFLPLIWKRRKIVFLPLVWKVQSLKVLWLSAVTVCFVLNPCRTIIWIKECLIHFGITAQSAVGKAMVWVLFPYIYNTIIESVPGAGDISRTSPELSHPLEHSTTISLAISYSGCP